jgi:hypothetical protein
MDEMTLTELQTESEAATSFAMSTDWTFAYLTFFSPRIGFAITFFRKQVRQK